MAMKRKIDRISGLPDSILTHILSFLDTRSAVRTSALSKRWRLVWTSLPSLDFYFADQTTKSTRGNANFVSFINQVLSLRDDSHLISLRFCVVSQIDPSVVEKCINYALAHNVQTLRIRAFCTRRPVLFPLQQQSFTSQSLKYLKITSATVASINLPRSWALPSLKAMHLKNFIFSDENYNGEIFSGCPNLETLVLCKCSIRGNDKLKVVNISGLKLRNLQLLYWRCSWEYQDVQKIAISCPGLAYFKYKGQVAPVCLEEEMHCIEEVCIDLWCPSSCGTIDLFHRKVTSGESVIDMLGKLIHLKALTLSLRTVEILSTALDLEEHGSNFGNLRHIRFKAEHSSAESNLDVDTLTNLLKDSYSEKSVTVNIPERHNISRSRVSKYGKKKMRRIPADSIDIPTIVLAYLLLNSPSAETLVVEFPEKESEEN